MPRKKTIPTEPLADPPAESVPELLEETPKLLEAPPDPPHEDAPPGKESTKAGAEPEEFTIPSAEEPDISADETVDIADAAPPAEMHEGYSAGKAEEAPPAALSDRDRFFHLDFHRLDRGLTEDEQKEWNAIYASYRGRSPLSGMVIGVDLFSLNVRSRKTGELQKREMFCAIVVPHRVRILIPETEMWLDSEKAGRSLNHLMGAMLRFTIIKVDRENGFALASRKLAMKAQRAYFARRPELAETGARLRCSVIDVGPVRCLVECYGHDITLTQKDLCYVSVPDLRYAYRPGQELDCVVTDYNPETDKLKISVKAALSDPFEGAEQRHPVNSRRQAVISGKYAGGVFCNLPDGTVCMCSYAYQYEDSDFSVGDTVVLAVKRFDSTKRQMYGKILSKW